MSSRRARLHGLSALVALALGATAGPAIAQPPRDLLGDSQLASVRGDRPASPATALIVDAPESVDATRSQVWVRMDNWFSEEGASAIAANVRASAPTGGNFGGR